MTLADYRESYYTFSSKASEITRQLGFAGIAFVWLFKLQDGGPLAIPSELVLPALLLVAALALDLAQAVAGTLIWGAFARHQERQGRKDDEELDAPSFLNWPMLACFWGKLVVLLLAYALIGAYVFQLLPGR